MEVPLQIDTELLTGPWGCTIEEYHTDRQWLSHSALELFRKSPRLYKMWFDGEWEREETKEFRIGSALHAMVLEPDSFEERFETIDCTSRNSKMYKGVDFSTHKEVLLRSEFEQVQKMASAIKCHSWIDRAILVGEKEVSYRFIDPISGIPCKIRPDAICGGLVRPVLWELKTTRDPSEAAWVRDAAIFGYHRQAAFYIEGLKNSGFLFEKFPFFMYAVIGSVEPYDVFVYRLDQEALDLGKHENEQSFRELKERRLNNDWRERNHGKIATVSLPAWYLKKGWEE